MSNNEVSYLNVWKDCPEKWQSATKDFWLEMNLMPDENAIATRLGQLCTLAIEDEKLIGVSTVYKLNYEPLRCDLYFFRCLVSPQYRRQSIARQLTINCRDNLQEWVTANPQGAAAGMAVVVESPVFAKLSHQPTWSGPNLSLVGYTQQGQQVRVVWFKDILLK